MFFPILFGIVFFIGVVVFLIYRYKKGKSMDDKHHP